VHDEELQIKFIKNFKPITKSHCFSFHVEWNVNSSRQGILHELVPF
jgi:hypothetical protein